MGPLESHPRITPFLWFDSNAQAMLRMRKLDIAELEKAAGED
jgi:predicted 3-demethylubiquinone-9 3-methyltransferase (glyoxalase superfamily)